MAVTVYILLAVLGAALVGAGVALWSVPVGLVVVGAETITGAYVGAYVHTKATVAR